MDHFDIVDDIKLIDRRCNHFIICYKLNLMKIERIELIETNNFLSNLHSGNIRCGQFSTDSTICATQVHITL